MFETHKVLIIGAITYLHIGNREVRSVKITVDPRVASVAGDAGAVRAVSGGLTSGERAARVCLARVHAHAGEAARVVVAVAVGAAPARCALRAAQHEPAPRVANAPAAHIYHAALRHGARGALAALVETLSLHTFSCRFCKNNG